MISKLMFQVKVYFHLGGIISVSYYSFKYLHRNVRKLSQIGGNTSYFENFVNVSPGQNSGEPNLSVVEKVNCGGESG